MKRKLALLLAGVLTLGLVGCGNSTETTTTEPTKEDSTKDAAKEPASGEKFELKLGHIQPIEHPLGQSADFFADLVSEKNRWCCNYYIC